MSMERVPSACSDEGDPSQSSSLGLGPDGGPLERRQQIDRRDRPTRLWDALLGRRRRHTGRRTREQEDIYVDRFERPDVLLVVAVFTLNIFDALFTMIWLQRGGGEANPYMEWLLGFGDYAFLLQKCFVVGLWLIILLVHKNFRLARLGLWTMLVLYSLILVMHVTLIATGADPVKQRQAAQRGSNEAGAIEATRAHSGPTATHAAIQNPAASE